MEELSISDIMDTRIEKCSGGQLKRVCIALELTAVHKPDLLFIDEPTTGLDSNAALIVFNYFILYYGIYFIKSIVILYNIVSDDSMS